MNDKKKPAQNMSTLLPLDAKHSRVNNCSRIHKVSRSQFCEYKIEHVILNTDGSERPLRNGDLDMIKHKGVFEAFKLLYELQKQYSSIKERKNSMYD